MITSIASLKPSRKADRREMIHQMSVLAANYEAGIEIDHESKWRKHSFHVSIHGDYGLFVSLNVDGDGVNERDDCYVLTWSIHQWANDKLSPEFESKMSQISRYDRQKATSVVYGFPNVLLTIKKGLTMATDHSAFSPV